MLLQLRSIEFSSVSVFRPSTNTCMNKSESVNSFLASGIIPGLYKWYILGIFFVVLFSLFIVHCCLQFSWSSLCSTPADLNMKKNLKVRCFPQSPQRIISNHVFIDYYCLGCIPAVSWSPLMTISYGSHVDLLHLCQLRLE